MENVTPSKHQIAFADMKRCHLSDIVSLLLSSYASQRWHWNEVVEWPPKPFHSAAAVPAFGLRVDETITHRKSIGSHNQSEAARCTLCFSRWWTSAACISSLAPSILTNNSCAFTSVNSKSTARCRRTNEDNDDDNLACRRAGLLITQPRNNNWTRKTKRPTVGDAKISSHNNILYWFQHVKYMYLNCCSVGVTV